MEMKYTAYINTEYGKPLFAIKDNVANKDVMKFGETKAKALLACIEHLSKYVAALEKAKPEQKVEVAKPKKVDNIFKL